MIDVALDQSDDWQGNQHWSTLAQKAVEAALAIAEMSSNTLLSISICLSSDNEVQVLNAQWRGKDKPTNVLSFPMLDQTQVEQLCHPREGGGPSPSLAKLQPPVTDSRLRGNDEELGEVLLGDIILAHGVCIAEADDKAIPLADHVTHLIIHGTLHLLGYDHIDEIDAEDMESLEVKALASLGLGNPYSDH
jgi:probable rRNA maturation factor